MRYIIDFSVISIVFLLITTIFYFTQRKVPSTRGKFFGTLLILGMLSLVFDIICALMDSSKSIPVYISYIVNIVFLLIAQLNGPIFLGYTLTLTGLYPKLNKKNKLILLIPLFINVILLFVSPFTDKGIFYISNGNIYEHGYAHISLYIVMTLYLLSALGVIIYEAKKIQLRKVITIFMFLFTTFCLMVFQIIYPLLLVNCMGTALALTIMYHSLELPDDNIDSLTRLLNRFSLEKLSKNLYEQNQNFSMYIFLLDSFHIINQSYGIKTGDNLMVEVANYLTKKFPRCYIFRITGDIYGVISTVNVKMISNNDCQYISNILPKSWKIGDTKLSIDINTIGLNSVDLSSYKDFLSLIDYIIKEHEDRKDNRVLLVDEKYHNQCNYYVKNEFALEKALKNDSIEVYYQPIHDCKGKIVALEALCRIFDDELGNLSPDIFIKIAEKNGKIYQLGDIVLERVCCFIEKYNIASWNLHHIGVNLSFLQCTKYDLPENILNIINKHNIPNNLISFEITETESSSAIPIVRNNMNRLKENGFSFLLDDFGSGYANYNYILELPFVCIKIDKSILWEAMKNSRDLKYLKALIDAFNNLKLITVCEGVETLEQVKILDKYHISMKQGYYYSKALNENEINDYYLKNK